MKVDNYSFTSKIQPLVRRFEAAQASDKEAEGRVKRFTGLGCASLVGVVVGIVIAANMGEGLLWLIPVALLALAISFFVKMSRASAFDLDDRKLATVLKLLRMLNADTQQESEVTLEIDFRPHQDAGKTLKDEQAGVQRLLAYEHTWMGLRGALMDGTRYDLHVTDHVARKEKRKRKYTKVKERTRSRLDLAVRLKAADPALVSGLLKETAPPSWVLRKISHQGRRISCSLMTPEYASFKGRGGTTREVGKEHHLDGDHVLKALLWIYDGISRARSQAA